MRPIVVTRVPELLKRCREAKIVTYKNLWLKNETRRRWALTYYLLSPLLVAQYLLLALRYRADLFVLNSRDDQIFGGLAASLLHRHTVWIDHADMKGIIAQPFPFFRATYFRMMSRARHIVAVSVSEKTFIFKNLAHSLQSRFVVINNGAKFEATPPLDRPTKATVITFVGRLEADKGALDLITAATAICKNNPNVYFWLVGKGSAEPEVKRLITASSCDDNIQLLGHLDNVYAALLGSDIFVYPTHHDASPLAPVEAMLAGLPIIATQIGGIPELVNKTNGILVPKADSKALQAALESLIDDEALRHKLAQGAIATGKTMEFGSIVKSKYLPLFKASL